MKELNLESRMKLHDIRDHMHTYATRRHVKRSLRDRLDDIFRRALEEMESGTGEETIRETLEHGRSAFGDFIEHDRAMESSYDRIVAIILSSQDRREIEPVCLSDLVRKEVAYFHRDLRLLPTDRLVFRAAFDPWVSGDRTRLQRVVGNLVRNAAEAVADNGGVIVEVDIASVLEPREGVTGTVPPGNYATLVVRDEGPGFPPEALTSLFDPGFSEKDGHMGLGLTFVTQVLEEMSGHVEVVNLRPSGAAVRVYLPLVAPPADEDGRRPA